MAYNTEATIRRKILGKKLARARAARGYSVEYVAKKAGTTPSSIYRQESGYTAVKPPAIPFYAQLYGVDDPAEIERWMEWARKAKQKGPWAASGSTVGPSYRDYADAEDLSEELRTWQPLVVPGLMQTKRYSEEIIRVDERFTPGSNYSYPGQAGEYPIEELLVLRQRRKEVLERETPPRIWAVIGEAAITMPVGDTDVRREQIQHLLNMGETRANIQILVASSGPHSGLSGAFTIMSFDGDGIVFREGYGDGSFIDDEEQVRTYRARYELLQSQALSMHESRRYLLKILSET